MQPIIYNINLTIQVNNLQDLSQLTLSLQEAFQKGLFRHAA